MPTNLSGKNVLVIGLGLQGGAVGTIQWLAKQQATIFVSDTKTKEELAASVDKLKDIPNITYYFGNQDELNLDDIDIIVRNPGVPRNVPILERARKQNIPIEMDSGLFFENSPSKNIIGITGSKGKTTASVAIGAVMKAIDSRTVVVGIDGVSPLMPGLDQVKEDETPVVFELSSWRLEPLQEKQLSPRIAVCTSLYHDHLNTYSSYEEYISTKKQIIRHQTIKDIAILNKDDEIIRTWEEDVRGELFWFSLEPLKEKELGIWVEWNTIFIRLTADSLNLSVCSASDITYTAKHELRNKLPAILIGMIAGTDILNILKALREAPVLGHRLQFVRTIDGVRYVNDSAATMPDATIAAIASLEENPLILILGGSDKALEFEDLAQSVASHTNIKHIIWLPGTATNRMKEIISPVTNSPQHDAPTMDAAVATAAKVAKAGETVLLSPGATSFGLFVHEFDRGDAFIRAVEKI